MREGDSVHVNIYFLDALVGVLGGLIAIGTWLYRKQKAMITDAVDDALHDVKDSIKDTFSPLDKRLSEMEIKMDVFWKGVATDAAHILHHPEPSRFRIDHLLDNLVDGGITKEENAELRDYLETIRDYAPDTEAPPFKVYPGEQVAAAILLHTMNHLTPWES